MKNLLFIIIATLFTYTVNAQDSTSINNSMVTQREIYNDVKEGITAMAETLEVRVNDLWNVLIIQQKVDSYVYLFWVLLFIISAASIIIFYSKHMKARAASRYSAADVYEAVSILFGLLTIVLFVVVIINFNSMLTGFVNPEYGAIKEISRFIKQ